MEEFHQLREKLAASYKQIQDSLTLQAAQRLLGHSDIRLTMNIYTEVQDDQLRDAVNALPTCRELQKEKFSVVPGGVTPNLRENCGSIVGALWENKKG